jgi:hypothetical protein
MNVVPAGSPFALAQGAGMGGQAAVVFDWITRTGIATGWIVNQISETKNYAEKEMDEL